MPTKPNISALSVEELLAEGNRLAGERTAILERQRAIAAELDKRAALAAERRAQEASLLGEIRGPAQSVF